MTICQSCGMNVTEDEDFGTESDGTLSEVYCFHCYKDGDFKFKGSFSAFIEKQVEIATRTMGVSPAEAEDMARQRLVKLSRWQGESIEEDEDSDFFEE